MRTERQTLGSLPRCPHTAAASSSKTAVASEGRFFLIEFPRFASAFLNQSFVHLARDPAVTAVPRGKVMRLTNSAEVARALFALPALRVVGLALSQGDADGATDADRALLMQA